MSTQQKEFNNENVRVIASRLPGSRVKLDIEVSPLAAKAAYKQAIKTVSKEISLPGFRKGKAPDNYILANYKSHVDEEWNNVLVNTAFQDSLELVKIYPFGKNSVEKPKIQEASQENGAKISIEYETAPEVPQINLEDLTVKKITAKGVSQEQKDDVITQIQLSHAEWEDKKDEPIKESDYVDLDIYNLDDNFDICKDTRFLVKEGKIGDWLIKLLLGKKAGDTVEGVSENDHHADTCTDPSHDHSHEEEFRPTNCRITIKGHQVAKLPVLDDALAAKAGAPNVTELMVRIEESLNKREENTIKNKQIREIEKQLADKYSFDLPASLLKQEIKNRSQHLISHLPADLNPAERKNRIAEIERKTTKEIEEAYRIYFITEQIAKENNLEISQEEMMQEFMKQIVNPQGAIVNQEMPPEEIRARLTSYLIAEKSKDLMLQKARQID